MEVVRHETCQEYFKRRVSEGWKCIGLDGHKAVLLSPWGFRRELDLRGDVETLRPNATGDEENIWKDYPTTGDHYDKVDEASADDDTTYVTEYEQSTYQRDLYNIDATSLTTETINKITVYARCRNEAGNEEELNQHWLKIAIKPSGGDVSESAEKGNDGILSTYTPYSNEWAKNPDDSEDWEPSDLADLQIGIALRGAHSVYSVQTRCTQVYVEVDYTAGVTHELAGVIAGVASVSGAVLITRGLAGVSGGQASVSGAIAVDRALAGISAGVASVSGAVAIDRTLAGVSAGKATVTGNLQRLKELRGVITGTALVTGSLAIYRGLAGVVAGVASVSGRLGLIRWLSGVSAGVATVTGSLSRTRLAVRNLPAIRNLPAVRNLPPVR